MCSSNISTTMATFFFGIVIYEMFTKYLNMFRKKWGYGDCTKGNKILRVKLLRLVGGVLLLSSGIPNLLYKFVHCVQLFISFMFLQSVASFNLTSI